jgi:predicted transcriptional regulator
MSTLLELTAEIVKAHVGSTKMTSDQMLEELQKVYSALQALEGGKPLAPTEEEAIPTLTVKQAFKKNEVICMICGKGGFKTLTRHLNHVHDTKPRDYRKEFNIPKSQPLTAKSYTESRKQMALDAGLGENLAKARAVRMAKIQSKKDVPIVKAKAPVPAKVQAKTPVKTKAAKKTK